MDGGQISVIFIVWQKQSRCLNIHPRTLFDHKLFYVEAFFLLTSLSLVSSITAGLKRFFVLHYVGSVVEWLKRRAHNQHVLGSNPLALFCCALEKTLYGTFPCLEILANSSKFQSYLGWPFFRNAKTGRILQTANATLY